MPKLSGREVLERLRTAPATSGLPVVIVSSSNHPEDCRRCRELGINGYLTKPLDTDRLREVLAAFGP
jgi:CheY-like chemotaxis protein